MSREHMPADVVEGILETAHEAEADGTALFMKGTPRVHLPEANSK